MRLYEAITRTNQMILDSVGDGNYNPLESEPAEPSKAALLSVLMVLDGVGKEWGVDIVKALEEARAREE